MTDVLRIALEHRERLQGEVQKLDEFIRMAEELITGGQNRRAGPEVDPFQARFNSGEVLPPHDAGHDAAGQMNVFRRGVSGSV